MKRAILCFMFAFTGMVFVNAQTDNSKRTKTTNQKKQTTTVERKRTSPNTTTSSNSSTQNIIHEQIPSDTKPTKGIYRGHEWVDLGLPSGTKWAATNIGSSTPSGCGYYFAWGETTPKTNYNYCNLKYSVNCDGNKFTKYVTESKYGNVDNKRELDLQDDAANVCWGSGWTMPTQDQVTELTENCKWEKTSIDGKNGFIVNGSNGNSIFLPVVGIKQGADVLEYGGLYWTNSLLLGGYCHCAATMMFESSFVGIGNGSRFSGMNIRPVLAEKWLSGQ